MSHLPSPPLPCSPQPGRVAPPVLHCSQAMSVCLSVTGMLRGPCREAAAGATGAQSQSHGGVLHRSALYHGHPSPTCCFQEQAGRKASAWFSWDEVFISSSTSLTWGSSIPTPQSWQRHAFRVQHSPASLLQKSNNF